MKLLVALGAVGTSLAAPSFRQTRDSASWTAEKWDAIVVGAGTAGIIVADRLSEAGKKTLLVEFGGSSYGVTGGTERPGWLDDTDMSRVDVPGLYKSIFDVDSNLLCPSGVVNTFQACAIGGNSAINAGLFFQPPASDWDDYHPEGWKSAEVERATQKLLSMQQPVCAYSPDDKFYLQTGYNAVKDWIVGSAGFTDVAFDEEPDNKDQVFGRPVYNYINGQRGGPTRTHLQSALERGNFRLQTGVQVKRIDHVKGKSTGITAEIDGSNVHIPVSEKGRVILSAGAVGSPGLLMHSGIGASETLHTMSQAGFLTTNSSGWVTNPAVGEGLFDNPNTFIELTGPTLESYIYSYDDPPTDDEELYLSSRSGPYAFASQTSAFWDYIYHEDGSRSGMQGTVDSSGSGDFLDNNTITLNVYGTSGLLSAGRVVLSGEAFVPGPSDDVYYSDPRDADDIAQFIHAIFQALPPSTPDAPAAHGLTPRNLARDASVDEIRTFITTPSYYAVGQVQHWSSSCRLGTCVDAHTRVRGTDNIHVVDASIVAPLTVNPQFGVMVAAERGAELLLENW
ncbi:GMC oxidoreductase [Xylariomycetidae sp. FL0641]|nr:GMC oxidoreductase [Xylariomycetidae sp. FL0641]